MGCDIHPYAEVRVRGKWQKSAVAIPRDRNYWAFSVLADVRNGSGFAGSYTGEPVKPIAEPRGLPEDTTISDSDGIDYDEPGYVWLGDHSHSWVTLDELLAYDLEQSHTQGGIITVEQKKAIEVGELPQSWCSMKHPMTENDVHATWSRKLRDSAWLIPKIIDALKPLGEPKDVRLVFGFDS